MPLGGTERGIAGRMATDDRALATGEYGAFGQRAQERGQSAYDRFAGAQDWGMGELRGLYDTLGEGGGYGGSGTGGLNLDKYQSFWDKLMESGGTPEQLEALRGSGIYDRAIGDTGLMTGDQVRDFRARGLSGNEAFFGGMEDRMAQGRKVQGGYGPGYSGALSQLARDRAAGAENQRLGVETGLADRFREDQKWGSTNLAGAERGIMDSMERGAGAGAGIAAQTAGARRAARSSRNAGSRALLGDRRSMIDQYTGLAAGTGGDIPYAELELGGMAQRGGELAGGRQDYARSQQKKDFWDKLGAVGGAAGSIGGGIQGAVSPWRQPAGG